MQKPVRRQLSEFGLPSAMDGQLGVLPSASPTELLTVFHPTIAHIKEEIHNLLNLCWLVEEDLIDSSAALKVLLHRQIFTQQGAFP